MKTVIWNVRTLNSANYLENLKRKIRRLKTYIILT